MHQEKKRRTTKTVFSVAAFSVIRSLAEVVDRSRRIISIKIRKKMKITNRKMMP
jgi:hypothetical protein